MILRDHWLIGSKGVYHGTIGGSWTRIGAQEYGISSLIREPDRLVAGASWGSGLWEWSNGADRPDHADQTDHAAEAVRADQPNPGSRPDRWKQLHDETLTEIMAIASIDGSPGVVAGSPYGIATGRYDDAGAVRWTHHSDALRVNERFINAILVHPGDSSSWLIGTEGGVLIADDSGASWRRTSISGTAVRALAYIQDRFLGGHGRPGHLAQRGRRTLGFGGPYTGRRRGLRPDAGWRRHRCRHGTRCGHRGWFRPLGPNRTSPPVRCRGLPSGIDVDLAGWRHAGRAVVHGRRRSYMAADSGIRKRTGHHRAGSVVKRRRVKCRSKGAAGSVV